MSQGPDQHEPDIVDRLFSYFDQFMDTLHDRVLRPILLAGRFVAYGFILFVVALVVASALVIGFVRFSTIYLFGHHVWITYLVVSAISTSAGLFIWRKRRPVSLRKP
ncbi:MAG: hypothetical protein HKL85_04135 [Acidimicrobiaceae bacterium]|nr:hypothetical protein [Acidimicrobiaceae bacterium]